jgi:hypothetical protein
MLISCLWFDTGGAVVGSAATTPGVPLAANTWTRFSVTAVAPVGADTTRLDISATTGTGSQPWVIGDYVEQCLALCEESDVLGTEIFGDMTAATNGADWTYGWAGAVGNSRSQQKGPRVATYNPNDPARIFPSRSTDRAYVGTYSMRVVWAANGAPYFTATGLTVGKTYTMQSHVYVPAGSPQVDCGGNIGGAFPRGTNTGTVKDSWVRLVFTFTATATSHDLYPAWNVSSAATRGDDRCYVDAAQLEEGSVATDYFDGDTTDTTEHDYLWLGTPHASISQRAVGPVLTWDGSTCLGPLPSTGRWADVSASLRWDETDALITWDTWRG